MISRYSRRPVSHKLEIRGLSRSSLDHPLPEEADDDHSTPRYLHDLQEGASTHNSSDTSAASVHSDCSTIITVDFNQSWSGLQSSTGTGISTERSSVFSWGYDEFDKAASRQVQQMFEEIDKELYEGRGSGGGILPGLQDECQQWASQFPHLRILGTQLVCPTDEGFQWYSTSEKSSSSSSLSTVKKRNVKSPETDRGNTELNVQGKKAVLRKPSSSELEELPRASSGSSNHDKSKVIEVEGVMEEYLAFDSQDVDGEREVDSSDSGRRYHSLPPVSPYRCRRQAVLDLLFDDVWRQLVGWTKELVQRHWEGCTLIDEEKLCGNLSPVPQESSYPFMLLSTLPTTLPKLALGRVPPLAGLPIQNTKSRGSKHKSRRKTKKQKRPSSTVRAPAGAAAQHNLNDLIVIQSIPLQQRNLTALDRPQDPDERLYPRPGSSVPSNKTRPRRMLEQSSSSLSHHPWDTFAHSKHLSTVASKQKHPSSPIGTGDQESLQNVKPAQRQKGPSSRAHSAVNEEVGSAIPRDRHHLLDAFSRPNTTHTYRSDTPYRRSFTILDNIGQGRPGRASVAADSLGIGVTGVSLGISSSSFLDSFPHHPLGHSPSKMKMNQIHMLLVQLL
ncbi:hypothetical protein WMY93_018655 [Mugilogobius chulae]|uniref:DUF3719 domain-containing protein n=1 Tax=Mugilogobius chulae TaxID=88201 RepID=A0AAW0NRF5_9GOBI